MAIKTNNKKKYIAGGIILAVTGIAYLYREQIKNLFNKNSEYETLTQLPKPIIEPIIQAPEQPIIKPGSIPKKNTKGEDATKEKKKVISEIDKKLKKGDLGKNVSDMQYNVREILSILKLPLINANGIFDKSTDEALLKISPYYKENGFYTVRRAREVVANYSGSKNLRFPTYLSTVSNVKDLKKIYDTNLAKYNLQKVGIGF